MKRTSLLIAISLAASVLWGLQSLFAVELLLANATQTSRLQNIHFADQRNAVAQAVQWLVQTHQNDDGGYTSFSIGANQSPSDIGGTLDAILAVSSAGYNAADVAPDQESSPVAFLRQNQIALTEYASFDGGQAGKAVMALAASNQDPHRFEGVDYVTLLLNHLEFTGQFNVENAFNQSFAILALSAIGEPIPESSVRWLLDLQAQEGEIRGSWDDGFGTAGNADATAMSVMALASTNLTITNESLANASEFLWRSRVEGGGWEYGAGFGANVNSTALAVQAMSALGQDFFTPDDSGMSPLSALLSWQGESGAFQADFGDGPMDDFFSTIQALPAAAGKAFPLAGRFQASLKAVDCLETLQDPIIGGWEQFASAGVDASGTARAIQAIAAVGDDPNSERWTNNGVNAVQALENLATDQLSTSRGGGVGIVMQAVVAAGGKVNEFAGTDLVIEMSRHLSPTGEYDDTAFGPFAHAEAMLGILAADAEVAPSAIDWLLGAHNNGDWGGADSTGIALNVLGQLGMSMPETVEVLRQSQEADGGWGFGLANPNSTSEVAQGLVAVGENPFEPSWSKIVSGTLTNAADAVLAQQAENGCWPNLYGPGDDPFGTTDAILLLALQPSWGSRMEQQVAAFDDSAETAVVTTAVITTEEVIETPVVALEPTETAVSTEMPEPTEMPVETPEAEVIAEVVEESAEADTESESSETVSGEQPAPDSNRTMVILVVVTAVALFAGLFLRFRRQ